MHVNWWTFPTIFLLLDFIQFVSPAVELFEAFDRKVFKTKKQRYATFDQHGILTLDGSLNGKSNDIVFPNAEESFIKQSICNREPKLMFEICEMEKYRAWTGLAICYESMLNQPYINPYFRIQMEPNMTNLVKVLCGERQNAVFINREVPKHEEGNIEFGRFQPFYSISTSFSSKKILFKMPNEVPEKACAILQLGGNSMLDISVTNLRKKPLKLYKNVEGDEWDEANEFPEKFPDLANRKYRLNKQQGLWFLMLDFSPAYGKVQNISIYGWLPVKIKIWELIQSREVSGGLMAAKLKLEYILATGLQSSKNIRESSQNETEDYNTKTDQTQVGVDAELNAEKLIATKMGKGLMKAKMKGGLKGGMASSSLSASFSHSWGNTFGSRSGQSDMNAADMSVVTENSRQRREIVQFENFAGVVNIEQLVYRCHGQVWRPDKIRYHDPDGNPLMPNAVENPDAEPQDAVDGINTLADMADPIDFCMDNVAECPIWAGRGECRKRKVFMLSRCKFSCDLCKKVDVDKKYLTSEAGRQIQQLEYEDEVPEACVDRHQLCPVFAQDGICHKNPLLMSRYCRFSCGLCVSEHDDYMRDKEIQDQEDGL